MILEVFPDLSAFTSAVILLLLFSLLYFLWISTKVRDIIPHQPIPFTNFVRNNSIASNSSTNSTNEENLDSAESSVENLTDQIFQEASRSYNDNSNTAEQEQIINLMDQSNAEPSTSGESLRHRHRPTPLSAEMNEEDRISIKLKYLNDEIKTVYINLNESVGSFKRRQFNEVLENKLVKLIFNGQILGDDEKSMSHYGLFSDAVVHCLILQKRNTTPPQTISPTSNNSNFFQQQLNSSLEWNGTFFIYVLGMILVSLTLLVCWYARIQYSSYFSWYSTFFLILMTSLFVILIPLLTLVGFFQSNRINDVNS